jgi:pSer/pThr/pTyr-binding forkhead associated (FHA) protein
MNTPATRSVATHTGGPHSLQPVRVQVISGPDRGRHTLVLDGTAVVGTRPDCALVLTDPTVSRRHLSLELIPGGVRVTDLGSKNGLRFQGGRFKGGELPLSSAVKLGETLLGLLPAFLEDADQDDDGSFGLVAKSPGMAALVETIRRVGPTEAPVLVVGETGAGKERVARAVHAASPAPRTPSAPSPAARPRQSSWPPPCSAT